MVNLVVKKEFELRDFTMMSDDERLNKRLCFLDDSAFWFVG